MVHVGVDLHKRVSQIAVLTAEGELTQHRLVNDVGRVEQFFAQLPTPAPVAIEASGTWWWLVDLLESLGHQPVLSHPKQTKAIAAARLKNDRVDAERLVLLLRGDLLPKVWIPPRELREARELLRHRVSLVWTRTEIKNRLLALLARRNLQPTGSTSWFTARAQTINRSDSTRPRGRPTRAWTTAGTCATYGRREGLNRVPVVWPEGPEGRASGPSPSRRPGRGRFTSTHADEQPPPRLAIFLPAPCLESRVF